MPSSRHLVFAFLAISVSAYLNMFPEAFALEEEVLEELRNFRARDELLKDAQAQQLERALPTADGENRSLAALALGMHYSETFPSLASTLLNLIGSLPKDPAVEMLFRVSKARIKLRYGDFKSAVEALGNVETLDLSSSWALNAYSVKLEALWRGGQYRDFAAKYKRLLSRVRDDRVDPSIHQFAATTYSKLGWNRSYYNALESLAGAYPLTAPSVWAFSRLTDMECDSSLRQPAKNLSVGLLRRLSRVDMPGTGTNEFILAKSFDQLQVDRGSPRTLSPLERLEFLVQARLYQEAETLADELVQDRGASRNSRRDILMNAAKVKRGLTKYEDAARLLSTFIYEYPFRHETLTVKRQLATVYEKLGYHQAAKGILEGLVKNRSRSSLRWQLFWAALRAKDYRYARDLLVRNNYVSRDKRHPGFKYYWLSRLSGWIGDFEKQKEYTKKLFTEHGDGFYALMMATKYPEYLERGIVAQRTEELSKLGQDELMVSEGYHSRDSEGSDSVYQESLQFVNSELAFVAKKATMYAKLVDDYASNVARDDVEAKGWVDEEDVDSIQGQEIIADYPLLYQHYLLPLSEVTSVDYLMMLSVMKAESAFDPLAVSYVGALGLMQIMPYTGAKIARLLSDEEFAVRKLKEPFTNLSYASYYMRKLLSYYDDNPFLAVAAYNAGPKAVNEWLAECRECTIDVFVENIPFRETRNYVKKVMKYYSLYSRIYRGEYPFPGESSLPTDLPEDEYIF